MKIRKRITVAAYCIGVFFLCLFAMIFPDYDRNPVHSNIMDFSYGWEIEGAEVELPYRSSDVFTISKTLPSLTDSNVMVLKCRYENIEVFIDGNSIFKSKPSKVLGLTTNSGNKELIIPMMDEYSGKRVEITTKLQSSIYGTSFSEAMITTAADYGYHLILIHMFEMIIAVLLISSGIVECVVAAGFIINGVKVRKEFTFEALLYAGLFSIATAVWVLNSTRIPGIICGNLQGYSIHGYIAFLLMPLAFSEMIRAMEGKQNKLLTAVVYTEALLNVFLAILILAGVLQWNQTTIFCHLMDAVDIICAIGVTVKTVREGICHLERRIMLLGSTVFVGISTIDILLYIRNRDGGYIALFLIALVIYLATQILIIFHRTGIRAEEDADYKAAKVYAFSDELTRLGNRRLFWNTLNEYTQKETSPDLTVVYMDVNRLKFYNDNFGHEAGDELLAGAAECIHSAFPEAKIISRIGGDEFALIIEASEFTLKKCLKQFELLLSKWEGTVVKDIHVAVGYASVRDYPSLSVPKLTKIADQNMLIDKRKFYESTGYDRRGEKRD